MMISLCGSPPAGFFHALFTIGLVVTVAFMLYTHYKVYKSEYYKEEFVYFSIGKKIILYVSFLMVNLCIIPLLLLLCLFLFS